MPMAVLPVSIHPSADVLSDDYGAVVESRQQEDALGFVRVNPLEVAALCFDYYFQGRAGQLGYPFIYIVADITHGYQLIYTT